MFKAESVGIIFVTVQIFAANNLFYKRKINCL